MGIVFECGIGLQQFFPIPIPDTIPIPLPISFYMRTRRPTMANASCWPNVLSSLRVM